jgi:TRAP transporter 4TM/12TM fusion protein
VASSSFKGDWLKMGKSNQVLGFLFLAVACGMGFYHLLATQYLLWGVFQHQAMHLGFALTLVFLGGIKELKIRTSWNVAMLFTGTVVIAYILGNYQHVEMSVGLPTKVDIVIGIFLVLVVIEATRQAWGSILPIVSLVFIAYFFLGHHLPEPFWHLYFTPAYIISALGIGLQGIFGVVLGVSANMVFLFMLFGGLLYVSGTKFVMELGKAVGMKLASGPAQTAVVGSAAVGTITGAAVANVAPTGSLTIPLMKESGYPPHLAGAIEATASTGSQMTPPVMGETAFLLATFIGVAYVEVMAAAALPAVIYFFPVFLAVEILARKMKLRAKRVEPDYRLLKNTWPCFVIPLMVIFILLIMRFTPMYAAFYGILAAVATPFLRKETRPTFAAVLDGFMRGAVMGAKIGVALACVGIIYVTMTTTGLGIKLGGVVEALCGGNLFLALVLSMLLTILLGCGLVTPAAYAIAVMVVGPLLTKMGLKPLTAHFFVFYFAVISALTPPVALASLAGASIAGANYWKTSFYSVKLALIGFCIPFLFAYNPILLLQPTDPFLDVLALLGIPGLIVCTVVAVFNYFLTRISLWERVFYALSSVSYFGFYFTHNVFLFILGFGITLILLIIEIKKLRRENPPEPVSNVIP